MEDYQNDSLSQDESSLTEKVIETKDKASESEVEDISKASESDILVEEEEIPEEESRTRRAFRKFIRWTVGILIVFGLGFLVAVFTIYNSKVDELSQSHNELEAAESSIEELISQLNAQQDENDNLIAQLNQLEQNIITLEQENEDLNEKQDRYELNIALLKARADVVSAQVELYEGNAAQARVLLGSASMALATIESLLPDDLKDVVAPLESRLELAVNGIEDDPETAIADLSIMAGDLLEIENALFTE